MESAFDGHDQRAWTDNVRPHRVGGHLRRHHLFKGRHVRNVHDQPDTIRLLRVDEPSDRDALRSEDCLSSRRSEPVVHIIDLVNDRHGCHSYLGFPAPRWELGE